MFPFRMTSEVQGECRAELARAMLSRSLHSLCISNAQQRYNIFEDELRTTRGIPIHLFTFLLLPLGLAEVFHDEGNLTGRERLGLRWHATVLQGLNELLVTAYPVVEIAQGTRGGLCVGKIKQGKFALAVSSDGKHKIRYLKFLSF